MGECALREEKQKARERRGTQQWSRKSSGQGTPHSTLVRPLVAQSPETEESKVGVTDGKDEMVLILEWRAIQLGATSVKGEFGQTVTRVERQVSQIQQCVPPHVLHTVLVSHPSKPQESHQGYHEGPGI